jgi:hypothetical protein
VGCGEVRTAVRQFTAEHKAKLSAAKLGKHRSEASVKKQKDTCASKPKRAERHRRNIFSNNLRKHNLSVQEFATLWLRSDGKCENPGCRRALDLDTGSFAIDHDHSCCPGAKHCAKCIRGLLCPQCNVAIGYLGDSVSKALGLMSYLHRRITPTQPSQ